MVVKEGASIYLDTNTVIYTIEGLLRPIQEGKISAVTSELTVLETIVGSRRNGRPEDERAFRNFLTPSRFLRVEPISREVLELAIGFRAEHGLKTPDAIHVATGLQNNCSIFITGDQAWAKCGVRVIEPRYL